MAGLSLEHIGKTYPNGFEGVKDFNLEIEDKEFIIFVGPSGCGKSTTLRMIAGLEDITSGTLKIDGRVVNDVEPADRDIAMVFQTYALYPHMTVYDKYGTSFGFPASAMGAHVSACPNEVNGRETPITTRGIVAMQGGGFGYELDLLKLPERACEHIRNQVKLYHEVEDLVREGLFFRLSSPLTDAACAWEYVAEDGSRAVVSAVLLSVNGYGVANYVVPRGLTPGALYRNLDTGVVYPADALMDAGFPLPVGLDANAAVMYRFERVDV